jgi:endo-1,4-beta-xylanase
VRTLARRYRGQIGSWIAVNQAVEEGGGLRNNLFLDRLGPGYIADAFTWAHEEDPDALLFYNDYRADGLNAKSDSVYSLVQGLLAAGVPIHGVGLQMHVGGIFGPPSTTVQANIQRFVDLGLAVNITEMDVQTSDLGPDLASRLAAQRVIYHDIVAACVAVPGCDTVTTWGFTDRYSWIDMFGPGQLPLPFDIDFAQKPAYSGMADALAGN